MGTSATSATTGGGTDTTGTTGWTGTSGTSTTGVTNYGATVTTSTTTSGSDTGDTGLFTTTPGTCAPVPSEVALYAEMVADAAVPGSYTLQVAVASEARVEGGRAPINLTMVLDTSGSMSGAPMDMLVHSCLAMSAALDVGDTVSMVTWDTSDATVIDNHAVSGPNDAALNGTCQGLVAGGGTNLSGGLVAGYQLALQNWAVGQTNRIVLVSDGGANAGVTDVDLIAVNANRGDAQTAYMTGVGVGTQGCNDQLMDVVTDAGRGASVFIASEAEAWRMLNAL
ncbi:MAG: VWA domain-containing protein [Rhodobacterales bacterium]|nr:VWA domain-containing protein [Rhodobacterales bacterium]